MIHAMRMLSLALTLTVFSATESAGQATDDPFLIAIHGGGGVLDRAEMTPQLEREYRDALREALEAGYGVLSSGGDSVSAVEAAIRVMEDSPLFNAGKGSSYNAEGFHEMDASIMEGATLDAGAVAVVQRVKNPISLARRVNGELAARPDRGRRCFRVRQEPRRRDAGASLLLHREKVELAAAPFAAGNGVRETDER